MAAALVLARQAVTRILVTGASGFVGRALVNELAAAGHTVRAAMRQPSDVFPRSVEVVAVSDLTRPVEWRTLLSRIETVVHLAGITHTGPNAADEAYDRVNRLATAELANAAHAIGIRHLVFISSIRAQCGPSSPSVLRETDTPQPTDAYGRSKLAAEEAVRASNVPHTILRPVLIYGPGVKGNLARLLELTQTSWPLPLALCRNRRSLVARSNLTSAIHLALNAPAARNQTFIVADPTPLTLAELVSVMRSSQGRSPGLLPVPATLLALLMRAAGRDEEWHRLGGTLVADPGKLIAAGWQPAMDTITGLEQMVQAASPRKSGTASRSTP
jgi:UDP-glucose 4-epimerase